MTLTEMLRESLHMEPECDAEAIAIEDTLTTIKTTVAQWLEEVGLPDYFHSDGQYSFNSTVVTRQLLVLLVDEP